MTQQLWQLASPFLSHRRLGEAEAVYTVMPDMRLSESNVKCVYVQTSWPESRYIYAYKISNDPDDTKYAEDPSVIVIERREGLYKETPTLLSKYERRGIVNNLEKLSYAQFCKEYDSYRKTKKKRQEEDEGSSPSEDERDDPTILETKENGITC